MADPVLVRPGAATIISAAGVPVVVANGALLGGLIQNPIDAGGQGIATAEPLYVSIYGPATLMATASTVELLPGESWPIPAGVVVTVSANAATAGHRFSAFIIGNPVPYPPTPTNGTFPPDGITSLTKNIRSYTYKEYDDDETIVAFFNAFNSYAQAFVDWFNTLNLPNYTGPVVAGPLLDWVAAGLYGFPVRPLLPSGTTRNLGPLNTYAFNALPYNTLEKVGSQNFFATTDDVFRRIITWHFFKGDGKYFNVRWLKRRVMRFLNGVDGVNYNVDQTYQVSVTISGHNVTISIGAGVRNVTGGAFLNGMLLNAVMPNQLDTVFTPGVPIAFAPVFKAAVDAGVLELPFQFNYTVEISG